MHFEKFHKIISLMILTTFVFTSVVEAAHGSNLRLPLAASNDRIEISLKLKEKVRPFVDMSLFPVGVGGFWFGRQWNSDYNDPKPKEITSCLDTAFKRLCGTKGMVMIDTAPTYGHSETRIGEYLKANPDKEDKTIIATKWGEDPAKGGEKGKIDYSKENLLSSVKRSKTRLGKIDILYLHGTGSPEDVIMALRNKDGVMDEMEGMKKTQHAGIKYLGVSITKEETLEKALKANLLDSFDVVQIPVGTWMNRKDLIQEMYTKGKAIVINSPVRWGTRLTDNDAKGIYFDLLSDKRVSMILNGSRYHFNENINHAEEAIIEKAKHTLVLEKEVKQAMLKWFKPNSGRQGEKNLYEFLANKGEEAIDAFVRLVEADRGGKKIGHYKVKEIIPSKIANTSPGNSPGPDKNMYPMPYKLEEYQRERIELMAHVAIQKALGRKVVLNVGIGHVGTAVMMVTSEAKKNLMPKVQGKKFRSPLSGEQYVYDVIGYDRPLSFCYYKVPMVKNGDVPIVTADSTPAKIIKQAQKAGNMTATFIPESIGIADIVMVETELHVRKLVPRYLEQDFAVPEPTLKLLKMIGGLKHKDALIIIESTVYPGFSEMDAIPTLNKVLRDRGVLKEGEEVNYAYAFQRMRPGIEWISSLKELQRIGAAVAKKPRMMIKEYFENVGFKYLVWDDPKAAEYAKDLENAWTYSQLENMVGYMRAAERLGIDGFKLVKEIVHARPETHQAMNYIPSLQPGGYCVPKELCEMIYGMRRAGMSELEIMEMFGSRLYSAAILDFKGEDVVWDLMEELGEEGISMSEALITWWGIAYKEGNEDTRMAGPERGIRKTAHYGADNIVTDPYATWWREMKNQDLNNPECWGHGLKNQQQLRDLNVLNTQDPYKIIDPRSDAFVLSTRHWQYVGEYQPAYMRTEPRYGGKKKVRKGLSAIKVTARIMAQEGKILEDTYNFLSDKDMKIFLGLGWKIRAAGKGHIKKLQGSITVKQRIRYNEQLLDELKVMQSSGEFNKEEVESAIATVNARIEYFKVVDKKESTEIVNRQHVKYREAHDGQKLKFYAKPSQKPILEARLKYYDLLTSNEKMSKLDKALKKVQKLEEKNKERVLTALRNDTLEEAKEKVLPHMDKLASILKTLSLGLNKEFSYPSSVEQLIRTSRILNYLRNFKIQPLANDADRVFVEMLTESGKEDFATQHRLLTSRPDLKISDNYIDPETLDKEFDIQDGCKGKLLVNTIFEQDPRTKKIVKKEDPEGLSYRYSIKWLKDIIKRLRASKHELPKVWSKHTMEVPLNLVKVSEGSLEVDVYPEFMDLPFELRKWLVEEVWGKGYILSTLDGETQDKISLLMDVNLDPESAVRGRGGVLMWKDTREPVIAISEEGYEYVLDVKAFGDYLGGNPERLNLNYNRPVRGGASQDKTQAVAITIFGQVPGHMYSAEDINYLNRFRFEKAYYQGKTPRPAFRCKWQYQGREDTFQGIGRISPSSERVGQVFAGGDEQYNAESIANALGWNAAEVLAHYRTCVHIVINPENILTGVNFYTDTGSNIDLLNERDPYGCFYKYFGYYMQLCMYTYLEVDCRYFGEPATDIMQWWLDSFMPHFLETDYGKKVKNKDAFKTKYFKDAQDLEKYFKTSRKNKGERIAKNFLIKEESIDKKDFKHMDKLLPELVRKGILYADKSEKDHFYFNRDIKDLSSLLKRLEEYKDSKVTERLVVLWKRIQQGIEEEVVNKLIESSILAEDKDNPDIVYFNTGIKDDKSLLNILQKNNITDTLPIMLAFKKSAEDFAEELTNIMWNHYVPYQILKNRLEFGYDSQAESTYTGNKKLQYNPKSEGRARKFIKDQRELLTIAKRLIIEEGYDVLMEEGGKPFDFETAFEELKDKEKAIEVLKEDDIDPERFASVYDLSFYPQFKEESVALLDMERTLPDEPMVRIVLKKVRPEQFIDKFEASEQKRARGKILRVKKLYAKDLSLKDKWGIPAIPAYFNAWEKIDTNAPEIKAFTHAEEILAMIKDDFRISKAEEPMKNHPDFEWGEVKKEKEVLVFSYKVGGKEYSVLVNRETRIAELLAPNSSTLNERLEKKHGINL